MHIAFLTPEYPHKSLSKSGGLGTSILNVAVALKDSGHNVSIIVGYQKEDQIIESEGITIYAFAKRKYLVANWFFYKKHLQKKIIALCKNQKIDVIEGPDWTGIGAFINFPVPYVVRLNGSDAYFCHIEQRAQKFKNFWLEKQNFKKAKSILSASDYTANITNKVFKTDRNIMTIYNSIDIEKFKPLDKEFQNSKVILYFGTLIRKKGVLDLALALNALHSLNENFNVIFLGKDVVDYKEHRSTLELIKEMLHPEVLQKVSFVQEVPYEEVQNYIKNASVICLPSYAEAFPMTWLEAMAMQKALVTSNIGWATEMMVDEETGFVVHPTQHKMMAARILELLENTQMADAMGMKARERVRTLFATHVIVKQNIEFYKRLLTQ